MKNKIKLYPDQNQGIRFIKPNKSNQSKDRFENRDCFENKEEIPPDFLIAQWDFFNQIMTYITYNVCQSDKFGCIEITGDDMKQFYNNVCNSAIKKMFNQYGKNDLKGIFSLFRYRNGIKYNYEKNYWTIQICSFLNQLHEEYKKDVEKYGKDFDKPYLRKDFDFM